MQTHTRIPSCISKLTSDTAHTMRSPSVYGETNPKQTDAEFEYSDVAFYMTARRYLPTDLYNVICDQQVTIRVTTIKPHMTWACYASNTYVIQHFKIIHKDVLTRVLLLF